MTWGDRQAEAAREKNLQRLKKLAASVGMPTETASEDSATDTTAKNPAKKAAPPKQETAKASKTAKPAVKAAANKAAPAKAKKKAKK